MSCLPGMRGCKRACGHRAIVESYRLARHADELAEERATLGYDTERSMRRAEGVRPITFGDWLRGLRQDVAA